MGRNSLKIVLIAIWLITLSMLVGCSASPAQPAPTDPTETTQPTATGTPTATPEPTSDPLSPTQEPIAKVQLSAPRIQNDGPIVTNGPTGNWESQFVLPSGIVFFEGLYYLFYNEFGSGPGEHGVSYSTSANGLNWTRANEEPLFTDRDLDLPAEQAISNSVSVDENGQWVMVMWGRKRNSLNETAIWRASAPSVEGPWTAEPQPMLERGARGNWDDEYITSPSMVRTDGGYLLFYDASGQADPTAFRIGLATSTDGIHWTKYDDPATTERPYAESDPVFIPGSAGEWDERSVQQPRVVRTAEGLVMAYGGLPEGSGDQAIGFAFSQDGIHWQRYSGNPVLTKADFSSSSIIHSHHLFYMNNIFFHLSEALANDESNIWLTLFDHG
jgi:predicted GH43/DUF377 family glycosyl hydrolase